MEGRQCSSHKNQAVPLASHLVMTFFVTETQGGAEHSMTRECAQEGSPGESEGREYSS